MPSSRFTLAADPKHLKSKEYTAYGATLPNTVEPIGDESYEEQIETTEDRFSITPLYTVYHHMALMEEYMIDRHLGSGAIKRADGTVVSVEEIGRLNYHLGRLHDTLSYLGMPILKVFSLVPAHDYEVMLYDGKELIDEPTIVDPGRKIERGVFSLDVTVLQARPEEDECAMARQVSLDPETVIVYRTDGSEEDRTVSGKASALKMAPINFNTNQIEIVSVTFPEILPEDPRELYVHSILVAC